MFGRLMPREGRFFDLFNQHADQIVAGAKELVGLLNTLSKANPNARDNRLSPEAQAHIAAIDEYETKADRYTQDCVALLHNTFITPIDREYIHQLINTMDDVLDLIQDVSESLTLYDIRRITPEALHLADLCHSCAERLRSAVALLVSMDNAQAISKTCREIDQLESDGDRVMRSAMSKLFRGEPDVRELIKLKAIYELLEEITDRCEDAANIIEAIVLENS